MAPDPPLLVAVQVANYCRERLQVLLRQELRLLGEDLGQISCDVDMKEHWDELFTGCFQRLDDEVSGQASRLVGAVQESRPVAAENVGSTAVVAVVCSSHVVVANCGDSRAVLCRGKEPVELSIDHKVSLCFCLERGMMAIVRFTRGCFSLTGRMSGRGLRPWEARSSNGTAIGSPVYLLCQDRLVCILVPQLGLGRMTLFK
jgi:hypothetical protein